MENIMKKTLIIFSYLTFLILIFNYLNRNQSTETAHRLINQVSTKLEKKFNISLMGISEQGDKKGYSKIGLTFDITRIVNKDEGRKIIIQSFNELLNSINNSEEMQPYLLEIPFKNENIDITLMIRDSNFTELLHPNISVISTSKNRIIYKTNSTTDKYQYHSITEESFEEAKKNIDQNVHP